MAVSNKSAIIIVVPVKKKKNLTSYIYQPASYNSQLYVHISFAFRSRGSFWWLFFPFYAVFPTVYVK